MAQPPPNSSYVGMMRNPRGKQYRPFQGFPQTPYLDHKIQTHPFHHLQGNPG